ncbi:MAG: glycosyltransferase [Candidatus Njordarchaeales archaeon]
MSIVSIVIPCYNSGKTLMRCLESIYRQTYKNYEIIVVIDKATKDNTYFVCDYWKSLFPRGKLKVFTIETCGVSKKRNFASKKAKGDILLFLDSDAELADENYLEKLVELFSKTGADVITGMTITPHEYWLFDWVIAQEYEQRFYDVGEGFVDFAATTCMAIKKDVFERVGGFEEISKGQALGEDFLFSFRLLRAGFSIFHSNRLKVFHRFYHSFKKYLIEQMNHAKYRVIIGRKAKKPSDKFTNSLAVIQSFLWVFIPISLVNIDLFLFLLLLIFFWRFPITLRILSRTKKLRSLLLLPVSFIRSIFWLIGAIQGFLYKR